MRQRASRPLAVVAVVVALAPPWARAQPAEPSALPPPIDPYGSPPVDELDAAVAAGLLERARVLVNRGELDGARLLATEAAERDPHGQTGTAARELVAEIDRKLGRPDLQASRGRGPAGEGVAGDSPDEGAGLGAPPPPPLAAAPLPPIVDEAAPVDRRRGKGRALAAGYGALGGATLGLGLAGTDEDAVAGALGGAAVGGLASYYLARRGDWDAARAHHVGAGIVWGAAAGGLFADVVTGVDGTSDDDIAAGAGLGALGGALVGGLLSRGDRLTADDAALVHSLAAWGLVGGLTTAIAIDPPEGEAYTLNGALGLTAGYVVGHLAARRTEISSRRLARINGLALLGAAVPVMLWRATDDSDAITDEGGGAGWGLVATAGLVGGAYLGFRWTRGMDRDRPAPALAAGPPALWQRAADGRWTSGGLALAPARHGPGATLTLVGGAW